MAQDFHINPATNNWDDNYWANTGRYLAGEGGGGAGGGNLPAFNFDWQQAEQEALAKLAPYYQQKLDEANGDVTLAKQRIEEDYQRGVRTRAEDSQTDLTADTQTAQRETQTTREDLNRRGLLFGQMEPGQESSAAPVSQYAQGQELNPLAQKQQARRMAIERALSRQGEVAGIDKARQLEDINTQAPRFQKALEQEKQDKAILQMAPLKYDQEYAKYQATVGRSMNPYLQTG